MDDGSTDLVRDSRGSYHATPNNFDELYDEGVIGKALNFDGVNDYLDMSLGAHPPSGTEQLTISFWSKGGFDTLSNTTLFESGTSLGRNLNAHLPGGTQGSIGMRGAKESGTVSIRKLQNIRECGSIGCCKRCQLGHHAHL